MSFPPRVSFVLHKSCRRPSDIIYIFCLNSTFQILSTFWPRFIWIFLVKDTYLWDHRNDDDWWGKGDTVCQGAIKNPAVATNLTIAQHCHTPI